MEYVGEYGLLLTTVLMVLWCWWSVRRRGAEDAASSVAALVWAPLAAGIAVLVNVPIRGFVQRPRPFRDHHGLDVLVSGKTDFSFVSDHATLTMAMGVALFVADRRFGLVGIGLALLEGFCRVYMGVHYPTDVVGGFALGTAVALLLSPVAMALLTPVLKAVERSRWGAWFVRAPSAGAGRGTVPDGARAEERAAAEERDLAA
jgi:undecaprenyl-diphosphatase